MEPRVTQRKRSLDGCMGKIMEITSDFLKYDHKCFKLSLPAKFPEVCGLDEVFPDVLPVAGSLQQSIDQCCLQLEGLCRPGLLFQPEKQACFSFIYTYVKKTQQVRKRDRKPGPNPISMM
uniref:Uncharacterized protein n=2 Tax=Rhinopithecus TaxID=542827 RepID=A0A2K6M872_RHIBE